MATEEGRPHAAVPEGQRSGPVCVGEVPSPHGIGGRPPARPALQQLRHSESPGGRAGGRGSRLRQRGVQLEVALREETQRRHGDRHGDDGPGVTASGPGSRPCHSVSDSDLLIVAGRLGPSVIFGPPLRGPIGNWQDTAVD